MGKLISLIYFYLVSIIGLILLIIGLYNSVSFAVNVTQYDKYPLRFAGNDNCEYLSPASTAKPDPTSVVPTTSPEETRRQKKMCEQRVEDERKKNKVEDMKNAIYFTLIGTILLSIHLPVAVKKSSEEKKK